MFHEIIQLIDFADILLIALFANIASIVANIVECRAQQGIIKND